MVFDNDYNCGGFIDYDCNDDDDDADDDRCVIKYFLKGFKICVNHYSGKFQTFKYQKVLP